MSIDEMQGVCCFKRNNNNKNLKLSQSCKLLPILNLWRLQGKVWTYCRRLFCRWENIFFQAFFKQFRTIFIFILASVSAYNHLFFAGSLLVLEWKLFCEEGYFFSLSQKVMEMCTRPALPLVSSDILSLISKYNASQHIALTKKINMKKRNSFR